MLLMNHVVVLFIQVDHYFSSNVIMNRKILKAVLHARVCARVLTTYLPKTFEYYTYSLVLIWLSLQNVSLSSTQFLLCQFLTFHCVTYWSPSLFYYTQTILHNIVLGNDSRSCS